MHNKKGQALIEFIIILPVIIYLLLGIVDTIMILSYRNNLESKMDTVITLYKEDKNIKDYLNSDLKNVTYEIKSDSKYTYIIVKMDYNYITPGLKQILSEKELIRSERVILNAK